MRISRHRLTLSTTLVATVAATLLTAGPAAAGDRDTILKSGFEGNVPQTRPGATPTFDDVPPAGRPWVLDDNSKVRVREDGRIDITLRGLVIPEPPFDGTNPAAFVTASLLCGGEVVDSTDEFPLTIPEGDARTRQFIEVPDDCEDPMVLIRGYDPLRDAPTNYFAFTA